MHVVTIAALVLIIIVNAQSKEVFQSEWIQDEKYIKVFNVVNDITTNLKIGRTDNIKQITPEKAVLQSMVFCSKMFKTDFIDNSKYHLKDLLPIYHESSNDQSTLQIRQDDSIKSTCKISNGEKKILYAKITKKD